MARTPAQRGAFGRWLTAAREAQYDTQKKALAAYRRLIGLSISESEYAQWESGSRVPKEDNPKRLALIAFYGNGPEAESEPEPTADMGALIATMRQLIEELQLARGERDTAQQVLMQALAAALDQSRKKPGAGRGTRGRTVRRVPRRDPQADPQVTQ